MVNTSVRAVPISTTNITGFFHWMSGRSMTNDCTRAVLSKSGANSPWRRLSRRTIFRSAGEGAVGEGVVIVCDILIQLHRRRAGSRKRPEFFLSGRLRDPTRRLVLLSKRDRPQMFRRRPEDSGRHEQQGADQQDRPQQNEAEREG